ncbi:MAG: hypothetical protein OEX22_11450 [Cyclobacteriaceae bacterium]|nr:hypothetical protein [Cyclobacteriaceae bacterium]
MSTAELSFMKGNRKGDGWIMINKEGREFTQAELNLTLAHN